MVGKEREFLNWFFEGPAVGKPGSVSPESINEYLRTFTGKEGVLGALGVYRAAFTTIAQTEPLLKSKLKLPVIALGGEKGLGAKVGEFVSMMASNCRSVVLSGCGHFIPEEQPDAMVDLVRQVARQAREQT